MLPPPQTYLPPILLCAQSRISWRPRLAMVDWRVSVLADQEEGRVGTYIGGHGRAGRDERGNNGELHGQRSDLVRRNERTNE